MLGVHDVLRLPLLYHALPLIWVAQIYFRLAVTSKPRNRYIWL